MEAEAKDFGIVIDGQFHAVTWMPQLVESLSKKVFIHMIEKIEEELNRNPLKSLTRDKNYTVKQVAVMTHRSTATITRHIRIGLLKGNKVGKSWLIIHSEYERYKNNDYA